MTDELKPCPFCGNVAYIEHDEMMGYRVKCSNWKNCDAHRTSFEYDQSVAIAAWNARHESDTLPSWAIEAIAAKRKVLDQHIGNEYVKNTFECGQDAALKWCLSCRKPEEKKCLE